MRTYPEYKKSGHPLIGLVPEHWGIIPNGAFFQVKSIKNNKDEQNLSVYRDYGVIPRDSRDDNHNRVSEDISNYKLVEVGDFVLNKMKCWMGSLGVSDYRGIVSPSYTVCEPIREIHRKYFHYLLRSRDYIKIYESLSYGVRIGQWELRFHDFKQIKSLYPPLFEQKQISNYLDRKTQQIDYLIEKTERKIELLEEQRSSLINQCVTKGLDPNVEMKDSGVEWIGEIPKGWKIIPIKRLLQKGRDSIRTGPFGSELKSTDFVESGIKVYNQRTVYDDDYYSGEIFITEDKYQSLINFKVLPGDLLITTRGTVGRVSIVPDGIEQGVIHPCLIKFRINNQIMDSSYLVRYINQSTLFITNVLFESNSTTIEVIYSETLKGVRVPIPSLSEQKQISDYLDKETSKIDQEVDTETKRIELLKEYRQSLISNVVTGKIDVRDEMIQ